MSKTTRILVVDDDPAILDLFSQILRAHDYEVWQASTGQQCLDMTRERRPDVVLLDVMLPDLSGIEVCRQIKADPALPDVFVILCSGEATSPAHKVGGLATGADEYLAKPVDMSEFLARIRTIVRLRDTTAALRASEQHYRRLIEILPDAVSLLDLQGRVLAANSQAATMLGCSASSELLGKSTFDFTPPQDHERIRAHLAGTLASGVMRNVAYTFLGKNGVRIPAELSATVMKDAQGHPLGIVIVARDITERKRAQEQIRLLADAVQSTHEPICITNNENCFTFVNRAFLETYGYTQPEVSGKTPDMLYSPNNPPGLSERILQQTLAGGWSGELLNRRKDGSEFPVSLNTSQIKNKDGKTVGLIGVAIDISERKRAEKQSAALSQLGYRLGAANLPAEAATIILDVAGELVNWQAGSVHLYSQTDGRLIPVLSLETVEGQRKLVPPTTSGIDPAPPAREVLKRGARLINAETRILPAADPAQPGSRRPSSAMHVPIHASGGVIGVLSLESHTPQAYSQNDLRLIQTVADLCGDALQRIEMADALRQTEAKYRSIVENATDGIFQTTPEGRYRSANPALARMLGFQTPEELLAEVADIERQTYVAPERREEFKRLIETQGAVRGFEVEHYRKDGAKIWVSLNGHVVRDAHGAVLYYEGTSQDITERKLAQNRLADALELNLTILSASALGILAYRASGQCIFANAAAARILGTSPEQLLQQNFRQIPSWERDGLLKMAEETLRTRKIQTAEIFSVTPLGRKVWIDCHMASFVSNGELHLLIVNNEITERKQHEQQLRQLSQRIIEAQEAERLRVARELHDGVNQIIASAKMRLRKVQDNAAAMGPAAREILARCDGLLVQALEENRRIAHNLHPSVLDELGLATACRNLCKELRLRTRLTVRCAVAGLGERLPPNVELNLFRIVQEALRNLEKHARAKTVRLRLALKDKFITLKIQDDGRGFDPGSAKATRGKEPGIGMTNMRERTAALGGTINIDSALKQGTTITVRVPCPPAYSSPASTQQTA